MTSRQRQITRYLRSALLIAGSAFCICACRGGQVEQEDDNEGLMTQEAFNLTRIESENGKLNNRFETPLMEVYEYAREPYREFRKGIHIDTFNSETNEIESTLIADYAIEFMNQQLWEAKGNVVATNAKGHVLETQQLFWNQRTGRIYSNIDTKITQGTDVIIGVGFESDEQFKEWEFRRPRGTVDVDVEATKTPGAGSDEEIGNEDSSGENEGTAEPAESARTVQPQVRGNEIEESQDEQITPRPLRESLSELTEIESAQ